MAEVYKQGHSFRLCGYNSMCMRRYYRNDSVEEYALYINLWFVLQSELLWRKMNQHHLRRTFICSSQRRLPELSFYPLGQVVSHLDGEMLAVERLHLVQGITLQLLGLNPHRHLKEEEEEEAHWNSFFTNPNFKGWGQSAGMIQHPGEEKSLAQGCNGGSLMVLRFEPWFSDQQPETVFYSILTQQSGANTNALWACNWGRK